MENEKTIIILLVIIGALLVVFLAVLNPFGTGTEASVTTATGNEIQESDSFSSGQSVTLDLPNYDEYVTESSGEYTIKAYKWSGGNVGELRIWVYKNDQLIDKDSYSSRAYFYMNDEWKWSDWGNGQSGFEYHNYPVENGVLIEKVEVRLN